MLNSHDGLEPAIKRFQLARDRNMAARIISPPLCIGPENARLFGIATHGPEHPGICRGMSLILYAEFEFKLRCVRGLKERLLPKKYPWLSAIVPSPFVP